MSDLKSLQAKLKLITLLLSFVVIGLIIASVMQEKEMCCSGPGLDADYIYSFLIMTALAAFYASVTGFCFVCCSGPQTEYNKWDGVFSILSGILVLVGTSLVCSEVILNFGDTYLNYENEPTTVPWHTSTEPISKADSSAVFSKGLETRNSRQGFQDINARLYSLATTVTAVGMGFLDGILLVVTGVNSWRLAKAKPAKQSSKP